MTMQPLRPILTRDLRNRRWLLLAWIAVLLANVPSRGLGPHLSVASTSQDLTMRSLGSLAFAHLVAFDEARSGFAHLHPQEVDLSKPPDAIHPELTFKVTIPQPGRYVIWGQVNIDGTIISVPFWLEVLP